MAQGEMRHLCKVIHKVCAWCLRNVHSFLPYFICYSGYLWVFKLIAFLFFFFIKLFSCSVVSDSLQLHGLQRSRLSCPSPSPGVCLNSCPLSQLMPSNGRILCHPFSPSFPASGCFPMLALCIMWPKYWSFSFSISPSNEYSGLISFRINWFDFLAVQGTLKSLLQHHSSKASTLQCTAFYLSNPHMCT